MKRCMSVTRVAPDGRGVDWVKEVTGILSGNNRLWVLTSFELMTAPVGASLTQSSGGKMDNLTCVRVLRTIWVAVRVVVGLVMMVSQVVAREVAVVSEVLVLVWKTTTGLCSVLNSVRV